MSNTPPTLQTTEPSTSGWATNTSPQLTASITVQTGDRLVVVAASEGPANTLDTPVTSGLSYTLQRSVVTGGNCTAYAWTSDIASNGSGTVSISRTGGTGQWGAVATLWRGSDGIGATSVTNATGIPSLGLTTTADNSAIQIISADFNAVDGASRAYLTIGSSTPTAGGAGELVYARSVGRYAVYAAYWADASTAGSVTTGLTGPGSQTYAIIAVEIKGAAGGGGPTFVRPVILAPTGAVTRAGSW